MDYRHGSRGAWSELLEHSGSIDWFPAEETADKEIAGKFHIGGVFESGLGVWTRVD